jgi:hypothetical protein
MEDNDDRLVADEKQLASAETLALCMLGALLTALLCVLWGWL